MGPALVSVLLLASAPWLHAAPAAGPPPDRVALLSADDEAYKALAIPRSYKISPNAPMHLLVFRSGLCVRDWGLATAQSRDQSGTPNTAIVEETGVSERAAVASDGLTAVLVRTRYVSRVDVTPGQASTANDTVTGDTTLTLIEPEHPDGRWRVTLEGSRWVKDVVALPRGRGALVTTFLPRNGPNDFRVLDPTGREWLRVPEASAATVRIEASPDGGFAAAEVIFSDRPESPERGVMVFNLLSGKPWTYGWRYGSDAEPFSWKLFRDGVLGIKLPTGTKYFDANGRKK